MIDYWCTYENMNEVCEHGSQRRKCLVCESQWQEKRIAELEQQLAEAIDNAPTKQEVRDTFESAAIEAWKKENALLLAENERLEAANRSILSHGINVGMERAAQKLDKQASLTIDDRRHILKFMADEIRKEIETISISDIRREGEK